MSEYNYAIEALNSDIVELQARNAKLIAALEMLFVPETSHVGYNLEGVLYDIERFRREGKPTDEICIRTIKRVITRLNNAYCALQQSTEKP